MTEFRQITIATAVSLTLGLCWTSPAYPLSPARLAGTWIAVDDGFPRLVASGLLLPSEEMLFIAPDGHAESRILTITGLETHYLCATGWGCSDILPVRTAKVGLRGSSLVFVNRSETADSAKITHGAQRLAASLTLIAASPQWVVSLEAEGRRARFEFGATTRRFAKIDAGRLGLLRGALYALEVSYAQHWRCFLSNATAGDPAFDMVGGPRKKPGAWFEDFLPAAAEFHRLNILTVAPFPGDPFGASVPEWEKSATMKVSHSLIGAAASWPSSLAERMKYRAPLIAIAVMARLGDEALAAEAARKLDPAFSGDTGVTPAGLAALRKVMRREAAQDPEVRDLFCLDLKEITPPRPDFDPFRGAALPR